MAGLLSRWRKKCGRSICSMAPVWKMCRHSPAMGKNANALPVAYALRLSINL